MRTRRLLPALTVALALVAAGCGDDGADHADHNGDPPSATGDARTVDIEMVDIAFQPTEMDAEAGETIRFVFTNHGAIAHDAFIGDEAEQAEHEAEMSETVEGNHVDGDHDDADAITVQPGESGELEHTFEEPGDYQIGCHEPGHYDAGMIMTVHVA